WRPPARSSLDGRGDCGPAHRRRRIATRRWGLKKMAQATHNETNVMETIREVIDNASADRVFGTPVSQDGVTLLPVAKVGGGGGGGGGTGPAPDGQENGGAGGGLGVSAKPVGVFVIK